MVGVADAWLAGGRGLGWRLGGKVEGDFARADGDALGSLGLLLAAQLGSSAVAAHMSALRG